MKCSNFWRKNFRQEKYCGVNCHRNFFLQFVRKTAKNVKMRKNVKLYLKNITKIKLSQVLTLVSNERIPFTNTMRMLLEIQDMKCASPATVSRGGVLFINESDVGWKPYIESWREKMDPVAQSTFYLLFSSYFEANIE